MTRRRLPVAPLLYLALAVAGHLPAFADLGRMTQCACKDSPQTDWFLAWTPHALLHGQTPWTSPVLEVPAGVNLMWNTLLPLPGLLAAPVTLTAGVLAAHTVLSVLAFASSATAMWWVSGRWAPWPPARFAAGLLYGFSPYMVAQGTGHLNLTLVALPPVVLLLADELLVRQRRPAWRVGALLGLVALAQLLTTEEVLASTFLVCVGGLLLLAGLNRAAVTRARVRHAAVGLGTAALVLTAGAAWPLSVQFAGPQRVSAVQDSTPYAADLLGWLVPGPHALLDTGIAGAWGGNDSENGSYLGLPLVLLLAVIVVRYRRLPVVGFLAGLGALAWVLSLGVRLHVAGSATGLPLPFAALARLPLLDSLAAVRLSNDVVLAAALLLAVGLDRMRADATPPGRRLVAGGLAVSLVCLLPAWPYDFVEARVPAFFAEGARALPSGAVVVTYPVPRFPRSAPMTWQAVAGFRYRSVGGYLITPQADGRGTFNGGQTLLERAVSRAEDGRPLPKPSAAVRASTLAELRQLGVGAVLVAQSEPGAPAVVSWLTALLQRPPDVRSGGVVGWLRPLP